MIETIKNIGIDANTDSESAKRIRLSNSICIISQAIGLIVNIYAFLVNWPLEILLLLGILLILSSIPITLNFFKKTIASRISFLLITDLSVLCLCITVGPNFHFQYFLIAILGMPLLFFGNEIGSKKLLLCGLVMLFFIYLQLHFKIFEPLVYINTAYPGFILFINDLMIILLTFFVYYLFVNVNDTYIEAVEVKSNELKEKNSQLKHFAYITSHDLNEPLRTVNSFVEIIQEEYEDSVDENLNTYFSLIRDALGRMRLMIEGLLTYSKIGKSGNCKAVDLESLIIEIEMDLGALIKRSNVSIKTDNLPIINCLPLEVRQLFQNLISNAIKFQQPEVASIIEITHKEKADYWQFCVADNGIGISGKKHAMIFQIFTKLHLPDEYEGQGIGLTFCKKIVEIHKGEIWVESSPDDGSRFYFTIQKRLNI